MESVELSEIVRMVLELLVTFVVPLLLKHVFDFLNAQIRAANAREDLDHLESAVKLIRQLVQAAEMVGLSGAIENIGREKKKYVLDLAEKELARRGINVDLDVLDALVEAQVKEAIKDMDKLFPEDGVVA